MNELANDKQQFLFKYSNRSSETRCTWFNYWNQLKSTEQCARYWAEASEHQCRVGRWRFLLVVQDNIRQPDLLTRNVENIDTAILARIPSKFIIVPFLCRARTEDRSVHNRSSLTCLSQTLDVMIWFFSSWRFHQVRKKINAKESNVRHQGVESTEGQDKQWVSHCCSSRVESICCTNALWSILHTDVSLPNYHQWLNETLLHRHSCRHTRLPGTPQQTIRTSHTMIRLISMHWNEFAKWSKDDGKCWQNDNLLITEGDKSVMFC